jgi:hypothetical protein
MILVRKEAPMVASHLDLKSPVTYRNSRFDFPTPDSPSITTFTVKLELVYIIWFNNARLGMPSDTRERHPSYRDNASVSHV